MNVGADAGRCDVSIFIVLVIFIGGVVWWQCWMFLWRKCYPLIPPCLHDWKVLDKHVEPSPMSRLVSAREMRGPSGIIADLNRGRYICILACTKCGALDKTVEEVYRVAKACANPVNGLTDAMNDLRAAVNKVEEMG